MEMESAHVLTLKSKTTSIAPKNGKYVLEQNAFLHDLSKWRLIECYNKIDALHQNPYRKDWDQVKVGYVCPKGSNAGRKTLKILNDKFRPTNCCLLCN